MTSNAGAQRIVDPKNLGFASEKNEKRDYERMKSAVMDEVKKSFKPEFINRIDDIIVFHQLSDENMKEIVDLLSRNLAKRCETRPLKRAIQSVVEDALAEEILAGRVKRGDTVSAGFKADKINFHVK